MDTHCIINTGNVRRCNHLSHEHDPSTHSEVKSTLQCTLSSWKKAGHTELSHSQILAHPKLLETIDAEERTRREIIVKLFVLDPTQKNAISEGLSTVMRSLAVTKLDVVLLSVPSLIDGRADLDASFIALWKDLESFRSNGVINQTGVCDLSVAQLQQLIDETKLVPSNVQIPFNSSTACESTKALCELATAYHIRIGTHNDTAEILPAEEFSSLMSEFVTPAAWRPLWIARYTVMDPKRSVITNLGYLVDGAPMSTPKL